MSESNPFHPETKNPQTTQEILDSLGYKFAAALDACLETVDQDKFDTKSLAKNIVKLHPQYLEHIKNLFETGVKKVLEDKKQMRTDNEIDAEKKNLSDTLYLFIERVEFFNHLKPPEKVPTGGKTVDQLERAMEEANINISPYAHEMMHKTITTDKYGTFTPTKETKIIDFVRFKVKDLFPDKKSHTFKEILDKAQKLGLELCQNEDGPNYRLHYTNQPEGEQVYVGMKQISDSDGDPLVFMLVRSGGEPWLYGDWTYPASTWLPEYVFVLRFPSLSSQVTL